MANPEPRATGGSGVRRTGESKIRKPGAEPSARPSGESKIRKPAPAPAEEEPAPRPSSDTKSRRKVVTEEPAARPKPESKVRRPAPVAAPEEDVAPEESAAPEDATEPAAAPAPAPVRTSESKVRKPIAAADGASPRPASDSRVRRGMGAPGEAGTKVRAPREERPDPLFKVKKGILLSMPVLLVLCIGMWYWASQVAEQNEAIKSQGPQKIVGKDWGAELKNADLWFDQAFAHRKAAMTTYKDEPAQRIAEVTQAIEKCEKSLKIYADAKADLQKQGEWGKGFEYIDDNRQQIEMVLPKMKEMLTETPDKEPEKPPATGLSGDGKTEEKKGEEKAPEDKKAEEKPPEEGAGGAGK